jgi:hypothetical protein
MTFRKTFDPQSERADDPKSLVDPGDAVIDDATFVEILEPVGLGVEDIAEGREREFLHALAESQIVIDFEELPD